MPGANYMGGKRNAARARVKDATGKVQRDHFGKKRFEILRTGLSKGHGSARDRANKTGSGPRVLPEISLAHATRACNRQQPDPYRPILLDTSATHLRSFPTPLPQSTSSRSRILKALDAENPVAQRAQLDSILKMPDLLGLSAIRKGPSSPESPSSSSSLSYFPYDRVTTEEQFPSRATPPLGDSLSSSPVPSWCPDTTVGPQPLFSSSIPTGGPYMWQHEQRPGSPFVPMRFDSSPQSDIARSHHTGRRHGTPEYPHDSEVAFTEGYEPTRVPFYSDDTSRTCSGIQGANVQTYERLSDGFESLFLASIDRSISPACEDIQDIRGSSVSRLHLPPPLVESQITQRSPYRISQTASEVSSLPPSVSSRLSWAGSGSHPLDSDVPQASFSLSPPLQSPYSHYRTDDGDQSGFSVARPLSSGGSFDADSEETEGCAHGLIDNSLDLWEQATLAEVLHGALFENADPWRALDDILCLRHMPNEAETLFAPYSEVLCENTRNPTCGVGYDNYEPYHSHLAALYTSDASDASGTAVGDSDTDEPHPSMTSLDYDLPFTRDTSSAERDDQQGEIARCSSSPSNSTDGSYPVPCSDGAVLRISTPDQDPCFAQASLPSLHLDQPMPPDNVDISLEVETSAPSTRIVMSCAELAPLQGRITQAEKAARGNVPCDNSVDAAGRDRGVRTGVAGVDDQLVDGPSLFSDGDSVESEEDG
ncbi:hypothetical protein FKP32DRAFT_1594674 [Trametes sanguinea]|nr:hypothetical protein FKP32DRAFT_1594674 [Trametes sanguinea]